MGNVTLIGLPTTSIASAQCGSTVLFTDAIYATAVTNATGNKFNVYDVTGTTLFDSIESATASFSFSQLTGYAFDTTYQVRVQVIRGTEYGAEGAPCTITVIKEKPTQPTRVVSNNGVTKTSIISEFKAYPNPFTTTFSITPIEGETATLFYQVYDVTGKMIESSAIAANEIAQHTIGDNYSVGMYLVIVRQGANTQTFKMIKQ
ncbi:T9SS type A sorting domain-containing protein [Flavobacterium sp. UBA6195]|uniref:T9SS type A sorting domain-containing protein n=1 Tax=Flavobacterium sp. UBA6195 TaxID=1946554 RepID=UPI0025C0591A|nr:T9SS type A sorting domain-containing protein [Flavobacterium sp. UBA6195]